jgi:hypothetical protein
LLLLSYSHPFSRHDAYSFLFNTIKKEEKKKKREVT